MVDAVHPRCDNDSCEQTLERHWQAHVRMMEQDTQEQEDLPNTDSPRRGSDYNNLQHAKSQRDGDLAKVKAQGRGCIHFTIEVMNLMETPQDRHSMSQEMPPI